MANMSAEILRGLVSSVFSIPAKQLVLSGEISLDRIFQNDCGHSWWSGASHCVETVFGFSPKIGFKRICGEWKPELSIQMNECVLARDYKYSNNGGVQSHKGEPLSELANGEEFLFFFVRCNEKDYGDNGETREIFTLYKAPDFTAKKQQVEENDTARWEQWLQA